MKTAVYVLYQRHEFDQFRAFFAQIRPALGKDLEVHVLINDEDCTQLRSLAKRKKHLHVHCENRNIGVAGGRNYLIAKARATGAEFLVSCDTDILFSRDYFTRLRDGYMALQASDPDLGYVQPILLNGPSVLDCFEQMQVQSWTELAERLEKKSTDWPKDLWQPVKAKLGEEKAVTAIFHTGVSNLWRAHFDAPLNPKGYVPGTSQAFADRFGTTYPTLRSEPGQLAEIIAKGAPVRIMSPAGGVTAFHVRAMDRSGTYNDLFNPFAFEDSELGFRSTMSGLNNYLLPDVFAIHDIFLGDNNRSAMYQARIGVLRGAEIAGSHLSEQDTNYALTQSLLKAPLHMMERFLSVSTKDGATPEQNAQQLPSLFLSYYWEFLRGMLDVVFKHAPDDLPNPTPLVRLLAGFAGDTPVEIKDFALPLEGAELRAAKVEAKVGKTAGNKSVYGFSAVNCRIEEPSGDALLSSRFFDLFVRVEEDENQRYRITLDVQSDEFLHKVQLNLIYQPDTAAKDGILALESCDLFSKEHDYGKFSVEDIYPAPSLASSTRWLPMIVQQFARARKITSGLGNVQIFLAALEHYLTLKPSDAQAAIAKPAAQAAKPAPKDTPKSGKKKILIFTDSRGQHKPAGTNHDIFAERLAKDDRLDVEMYLCPMKWTTTLDFLERFPEEKLKTYDHVILYTGIVEWSPRPAPSALADLYDNPISTNAENLGLNTRDYSKKIVNNKKAAFNTVFGAGPAKQYLETPFDTEYEGEKTINMYGLDMAREHLLPRLKKIPNLIFITANRFVKGWEGDFRRGRPKNIPITHDYSDLFAKELSAANIPLVDLRKWDDVEIQNYTCDNIHLSKAGSDFIFDQLIEHMQMHTKAKAKAQRVDFQIPNYTFKGFGPIERLIGSKRGAIMKAAKCTDASLATLIIGVRHDPTKPERLDNLRFLLKWIDFYYGDLFDVLLIEQDTETRLDLKDLGAKDYVRHAFIYNSAEYNRGWGYNVAVKHHCKDAKVVALMDVDVLTGPNFVRDVMDCHALIDVASPYLNIYYTDPKEAKALQSSMTLANLTDKSHIKNPVTVAGGIVIWNRNAYMSIKGFEQYVGYSCEDRAMDVTIFNHFDKKRIRISPQTYVHLYHTSDQTGRKRFDEIYGHLTSTYQCQYDPTLTPFSFIHQNCQHVDKIKTNELLLDRGRDFGDPDLYQRGDELTINGQRLAKPPVVRMDDAIFPPDFKGLDGYAEREVYANTPLPDVEELAQFHNRFQGQRCFIIGNGPSLNKHDLSLLEGEYSFGVNSFYYKTRESGFRPTFYVVEDSSVMKENIEEVRAYEAPYKFFPTIYKRLHPKTPNTFFFEMNRGFYERTSPNYAVPRFSTDASNVLYCGQSVTYINLQLAFFMGFTEVYLLGMDFDYVIPKSHKRTGDVLLSDTDDPNHFHKDYFGKGKTWKDPKLERVLMNYRQADIAYSAVERKIYNATVGGKLEVFDRVDYDKLLCDPETGKKRQVPARPVVTARASLDRQMGREAPTSFQILGQDVSGTDTSSTDVTTLSASLLLNPVTMLPRVEVGGDLAPKIEAVLKAGGPTAEHLIKVRDWARKRVSSNSNIETQEKAG
jgi:6-hydroxymethylpterin diphosphokinase MptE-like